VSDALIASLQDRINQLQQENATIRAEAKDRRIKGKAQKERLEELERALGEIAAERDEYKTAIEAEPHELQKQVDEYRGKLRDRDHRDKFRELARTQGVTHDKALDDLWSLSGYKADADTVDETKLTAAITGALAGRDWLKATPAPAGANGTAGAPATTAAQSAAEVTRPPGPGATRGAGSGTGDPDAALAARYPDASRLA
jgi:hypothetical protein